MEQIQLTIRRLLLIGVLVSFVMVTIGGGAYLLKHSTDVIHYTSFHGEAQIYKSIIDIFSDALTLSPLGLIQLGLLILVIIQILLVGMTTWLFIQSRDSLFTCISLFILFVLMYSLMWHF